MKRPANLVIHISGASGSGKSTLGKKIEEKFKSKIVVKDLDDLRYEFTTSFYGERGWTYIDEEKYQKHIYDFISKQTRPIVFVGLNDNTIFGKNKDLYYEYRKKIITHYS